MDRSLLPEGLVHPLRQVHVAGGRGAGAGAGGLDVEESVEPTLGILLTQTYHSLIENDTGVTL